jgi:hypothetical protein
MRSNGDKFMAKNRENAAKVTRLRKAVDILRAELAELDFFLSDELKATLNGSVAFLNKRCETLCPEEDETSRNDFAAQPKVEASGFLWSQQAMLRASLV